jgi:hypothetical protein
VAEAPDGLELFEVLLCAFRKSARNLENNRPFSEPRWKVIAATPALRERELAKHAWLTDAVAEALRQRGVDDWSAGLAARTGWAAYQHAVQAWIDNPAPSLDAYLLRAFDDLRALSAAALPTQAGPEHRNATATATNTATNTRPARAGCSRTSGTRRGSTAPTYAVAASSPRSRSRSANVDDRPTAADLFGLPAAPSGQISTGEAPMAGSSADRSRRRLEFRYSPPAAAPTTEPPQAGIQAVAQIG